VIAPQTAPLVIPKPAPPRPRPEHAVALADDLKSARVLLEGTDLERAAGVATVALVEHFLRNMATAMGGQR
jgi:hypothetical protein